MAKSRMIDPRMWSDGWFRRLNALDRYAFMYFLTNEHSSWCGVYELDISMSAFESGIDERDLKNSILPNLQPKVYYIDGWIYIKNWAKYHSSASPQTQKGINLAWNSVPEEIRLKIAEIDTPYIHHTGGMVGVSSSASASASASAPTVGIENDAPLSEKNLKSKPNSPRGWANLRRAEIGKPPIRTPRSEKQTETFEALKWKDYFRDQGYTQHGMQFFKVKSEKRESAVSKLIIEANKNVENMKELIDWWFEGNGEWAQYEPEQCFMGKTLERFLNKNKGKQNKPLSL